MGKSTLIQSAKNRFEYTGKKWFLFVKFIIVFGLRSTTCMHKINSRQKLNGHGSYQIDLVLGLVSRRQDSDISY